MPVPNKGTNRMVDTIATDVLRHVGRTAATLVQDYNRNIFNTETSEIGVTRVSAVEQLLRLMGSDTTNILGGSPDSAR